MRSWRTALYSVIAFCLFPGFATAQVVTEFSAGITGGPAYITSGPDGNLWFTEEGFPSPKIGRITPAGVVTEFSAGITGPQIFGITAGPDGNLWFAEYNQNTHSGGIIGRITPAGVVTEFPIPGVLLTPTPWAITAGPDGNLWFTDSADIMIGRITTAGTITMFPASPGFASVGIAAGPDGNLWFTDGGNAIDRITTAGVVTSFNAGVSSPGWGIAAGPDGNLWFAEYSTGNKIGRITTAGVVTEFSAGLTGNPDLRGIASGPDGNLWFTEQSTSRIGRITPTGTITEFSAGITPGSGPLDITAGPDGNLWFTEPVGRIGRITTAGGGGPAATTTTVASSLNPSTGGQSVTFTATVAGSSPTGTMQFKDGAANLGAAVALSGASASLTTSTLAVGTHPITAVYSGDAGNAPSTSPILTQVVNAVPPPTTPGQPIPTLSEWGVLLLSALLGGLGIWRVRRRS